MVYFIIISGIIFIDRITKTYIEKNLKLHEKKELVKNKIYLWHYRNIGVAYSLFKDKAKQILKLNLLVVTVLLFLLFYLIKFKKGERLLKVIIAFIIGGATGNIIDRVKNGYVTDFLYFNIKKSPVFNIADLFLLVTPVLSFLRSLISK